MTIETTIIGALEDSLAKPNLSAKARAVLQKRLEHHLARPGYHRLSDSHRSRLIRGLKTYWHGPKSAEHREQRSVALRAARRWRNEAP